MWFEIFVCPEAEYPMSLPSEIADTQHLQRDIITIKVCFRQMIQIQIDDTQTYRQM